MTRYMDQRPDGGAGPDDAHGGGKVTASVASASDGGP